MRLCLSVVVSIFEREALNTANYAISDKPFRVCIDQLNFSLYYLNRWDINVGTSSFMSCFNAIFFHNLLYQIAHDRFMNLSL